MSRERHMPGLHIYISRNLKEFLDPKGDPLPNSLIYISRNLKEFLDLRELPAPSRTST